MLFGNSFYTLSVKQNSQHFRIGKKTAFTSGRADRRNLEQKSGLRVMRETHTFAVQNETGENQH